MGLEQSEIQRLLNLLYDSKDTQAMHGTHWKDKRKEETFYKKINEMTACELHKDCVIMRKLMGMLE